MFFIGDVQCPVKEKKSQQSDKTAAVVCVCLLCEGK